MRAPLRRDFQERKDAKEENMKLAEKMVNIAENTLDEKVFEAFKNEALRRIENVASLGRRRHEVYFDYSADPIKQRHLLEKA